MRSIVVVALSLAVACASTSPPPARPSAPAAKTSRPPSPRDKLTRAVRVLDARGDDLSHRRVVGVLEALADVVARLPDATGDAADKIRASAHQLASSPQRSLGHADIVLAALRDARRALEAQSARTHLELARAFAVLDDVLDRFDRAKPLLDQKAELVTAFEAIDDAAAAAHGAAPPFALPAISPPARPRSDAVADLRDDVLATARADWTHLEAASAKVLADLADIIGSSPNGDPADSAELRFQAKRLASTRQDAFDVPRWIKTALAAALETLERRDRASAKDARAAVANIDDSKGLAFQRGAIQDALRATVDAFLHVELGGCSRSRAAASNAATATSDRVSTADP